MFTCLQTVVLSEPPLLLRLLILRCRAALPADPDRPLIMTGWGPWQLACIRNAPWPLTATAVPLTGYAALRSFAMLISALNARLKAYGDALHAD